MLLIRGAQQLITLRGPCPRRGSTMSDLGIIHDGAVLIDGERIDEVGPTRRVENLTKARGARVIDATGKVVLPGLIDAHSRLLFDRLPGGEQQLGDSFGETESTKPRRARSARTLHAGARRWTYDMASCGTTTVEIRVGGDPGMVRRRLRAAATLSGDPILTRPVLAVSSFVPFTERADAASEPSERTLEWGSNTETAYAIEIYCGEGGVKVADAQMLGELAARCGLDSKLFFAKTPTEELCEIVESQPALSIDIASEVGHRAIRALSGADSVITILPGIAFHTKTPYPQARALIDTGAAVCLATGFGPEAGASFSLPMMMALACRRMRMAPAEAITSCTLNAAVAVGQEAEVGSIEPGKLADLALFDTPDYREIPHYFGFNLCTTTIRRGKIIYYAGSVPPVVRPRLSST